MLEQILTFTMSYVQLIITGLLLIVVILKLIHIGQIRRINKKLNYAAIRLQQYLDAVFVEEAQEPQEAAEEEKAQLEVPQQLKSQQEEHMRVSLEQRKQQKDGELLDTVLQEIFD